VYERQRRFEIEAGLEGDEALEPIDKLGEQLQGPIDPGFVRGGQMHHLLNELALLAVGATLAAGGDREALAMRLAAALEFLENLRTVNRSRGDESNRTNENTWTAAVVWERHDVQAVFKSGLEDNDYFYFSHDALSAVAADYFDNRWMRHPAIDWIIVDAFVTGETILFGEDFKKLALVGPRDDIGVFHAAYWSTKGNLSKMREHSRKALSRHIVDWSALYFVVPICILGLIFYAGYATAGYVLAGAYVGLLVLEVVGRWMRGHRGAKTEEERREGRRHQIWLALYDVWRLLNPPVINPTNLKKAITSATENGAVISQMVHAIAEDRFRIDPAIWVTRPRDAVRQKALFDQDYDKLRARFGPPPTNRA
jgi:hypothetical protein